MQNFSNNSAGTIFSAIGPSDTSLSFASGKASFKAVNHPYDNGEYQVLTLSDVASPSIMEIVHITKFDPYESSLKVVRGREGTTARSWPAGTKMSARVTAGVMRGLVQNVASGDGPETERIGIGSTYQSANMLASSGFAVMADSRSISDAWVIGGYPVLQFQENQSNGLIPRAMAVEAIATTYSMDLGDSVPPWSPGASYVNGDVVRPTTPNGKQYRLYNPSKDAIEVPATEPFTWGETAYARGIVESGPDVPMWISNGVLSAGIKFQCIQPNVLFYPSEFGFICKYRDAGYGAFASVSIGSMDGSAIDNPTLYVNNVAMTDITDDYSVHRFPVAPTMGASGFSIRLETPVAGGTLTGRFYAKGMFFQIYE